MSPVSTVATRLATPAIYWIALLALCSAYLLGGLTKLFLFDGRFWELAPPERIATANACFEHLGLVGAFLLVAWHDLRRRRQPMTR